MKQKVGYDLSLTDGMTVREVERIFCEVSNNGMKTDDPDLKVKTSAVAMWKTISPLRFTPEATNMTIRELREWASIVRSAFVCIHRVNYSAYYTMQAFYDWYEEKRKVSFNVKRFWRKTSDIYDRYQKVHMAAQEIQSWRLLQDHMRLMDDEVQEPLSRMEPTITNVFIRQRGGKSVVGQLDDIELLAKAEIPLLWTRVIHHSFADFFMEYIKKCGVDFTYDFKYADLSGMSLNFCRMLEQMGVKMHNDENGDAVLDFFSVDDSSTIEAAWNAVMRVVRDERLADDMAGQALELNPVASEKYREAIEESEARREQAKREKEERRMSIKLDALKRKYNVEG